MAGVDIGPFQNIVNVGWGSMFALVAFGTATSLTSDPLGVCAVNIKRPRNHESVAVFDPPGSGGVNPIFGEGVSEQPVGVSEFEDLYLREWIFAPLSVDGSVARLVFINVGKILREFGKVSLSFGLWVGGSDSTVPEVPTSRVGFGDIRYAFYGATAFQQLESIEDGASEYLETHPSAEQASMVALGAHQGGFGGLLGSSAGGTVTPYTGHEAVAAERVINILDLRWDYPNRGLPGVVPFLHAPSI